MTTIGPTGRILVATVVAFAACSLPLMLGGCPVQQVPREGANTNGNANASDGVDGTPSTTNSNTSGAPIRPIPNVAIIDEEVEGPIDSGLPNIDSNTAAPLSIVISSLELTLNTLPGTVQTISYEVFGGSTRDGPVAVRLYHDRDGVAESGDEVFFAQNLPGRALVDFNTAGLAPGRYFVGVEARNLASVIVRYAVGQLELVGPAAFSYSRPQGDLRVRPTGQIDVRGDITTLARNVGWRVFTDVDTIFNGNEVTAFAGGGTRVNGAIFPIGLPRGAYYIGIEIVDSLTQRFVQYLAPLGSNCATDGNCRTFTIDEPPVVNVTAPGQTILSQPGQVVRVTATVSDTESGAQVTLFRDADSAFNNNEFILAQFQLSGTESTFSVDFDSTGLFPGTYRFGAIVDDGAGSPVSAYAAGTLIILEAPSATADFFYPAIYARRAGDTSPISIYFLVEDPLRRLSLQPFGIRLNLYKDENSDGVRDSSEPIVSTTNDAAGTPFRIGTFNRYDLNLDSLGLVLGGDGLADVLGEVVLNERIGNVTTVPAEFELARLDNFPPTLQIISPTTPVQIQADAMEFPQVIRFRMNDNAPLGLLRVKLREQVDLGLTPRIFTVYPLDVVDTNRETSVDVELGAVPVGTWALIMEFDDGTGTFLQRVGTFVQVTD